MIKACPPAAMRSDTEQPVLSKYRNGLIYACDQPNRPKGKIFMKKRAILLSVLIAGISLLASICWAESILDQGKQVYESNCMLCHGENGKGDGPAAAVLNPKPADYTKPSFWTSDAAQHIATTIKNGKGQMPPFALDAASVKAVIYYIEHTFKPAGASKP